MLQPMRPSGLPTMYGVVDTSDHVTEFRPTQHKRERQLRLSATRPFFFAEHGAHRSAETLHQGYLKTLTCRRDTTVGNRSSSIVAQTTKYSDRTLATADAVVTAALARSRTQLGCVRVSGSAM